MRTSALFGTKIIGFFLIYVSARTMGGGEGASADILRTKGEGVNFSQFCADVLYGRPLSNWA